MPAPLIAGPTFLALATGALIGVGVAALIYETELIEDIKQGIKEGVETFVEKRRRRETPHPLREMVQVFSGQVAAPTPNSESPSRSASDVNPFEDTFDDLYHTPSFSSSQKLHFGSSTDSDEDSDGDTQLVRRRGQRKTSSSFESLSSNSARVSKRFRAPANEKVVLFGNTTAAFSTDEAETESTTTSDAGVSTPSVSQSETNVAMLSSNDSDSNFSDPVMVELTSDDDQSEQEPSSSVSTLKSSRAAMTN